MPTSLPDVGHESRRYFAHVCAILIPDRTVPLNNLFLSYKDLSADINKCKDWEYLCLNLDPEYDRTTNERE